MTEPVLRASPALSTCDSVSSLSFVAPRDCNVVPKQNEFRWFEAACLCRLNCTVNVVQSAEHKIGERLINVRWHKLGIELYRLLCLAQGALEITYGLRNPTRHQSVRDDIAGIGTRPHFTNLSRALHITGDASFVDGRYKKPFAVTHPISQGISLAHAL